MARYSVALRRNEEKGALDIRLVDYISPAGNKDFVRSCTPAMLAGTYIPEEHQHIAGALCAMLLDDEEVRGICIQMLDDQAGWVAEATLSRNRSIRCTGATPTEAIENVIHNLPAD